MRNHDQLKNIYPDAYLFAYFSAGEIKDSKVKDKSVVCEIFELNKENHSITFSEDISEGRYTQWMKANVDHLINGVVGVSKMTSANAGSTPELIYIVRNMMLCQRVEEDIHGIHDILWKTATLSRFHADLEISTFTSTVRCELNNQLVINTLCQKSCQNG